MIFAPAMLTLALSQIATAADAGDSRAADEERVVALYRSFEYERALTEIDRVRAQGELSPPQQVWLDLFAGILAAELRLPERAESEFKAALSQSPDAQLPVPPSRKVRELFERVRHQAQEAPRAEPKQVETPLPRAGGGAIAAVLEVAGVADVAHPALGGVLGAGVEVGRFDVVARVALGSQVGIGAQAAASVHLRSAWLAAGLRASAFPGPPAWGGGVLVRAGIDLVPRVSALAELSGELFHAPSQSYWPYAVNAALGVQVRLGGDGERLATAF